MVGRRKPIGIEIPVLAYADIPQAQLSGANLGGADLSSANLSSADLSKADLSGADLSLATCSPRLSLKDNLIRLVGQMRSLIRA